MAALSIDDARVQSTDVTARRVTFTPVSNLTVTHSPHSVYVAYDGDSHFTPSAPLRWVMW
jgi:hypothetical protein